MFFGAQDCPEADPPVAVLTYLRAEWASPRILAVAVLAPVMFATSLAASGGLARTAAPLWTALVAGDALRKCNNAGDLPAAPWKGRLRLDFG